MRITWKGAVFFSAVLAACFTVMSVIVTLPAPPAPTIKAFSSVYGLELYPDVRIIRTDRPQENGRQMVDRTHKGDRLGHTDDARNRYQQFKDWSSAPGQPWNATYNIG